MSPNHPSILESMEITPYAAYALPFLGAVLGMGIARRATTDTAFGFKLILAFSGSFLLGIAIFHLMPLVFSTADSSIGLWIVGGLLLQTLLEHLSHGAEHGHAHIHTSERLPAVLFLSLGLHALVEGMPLEQNTALVWGVFVHKIPIGVVFFTLIKKIPLKEIKKLFYLACFALMTPLGTLIGTQSYFETHLQTPLNALVLGMILHIATTILFESNQSHAFNFKKLMTVVLGFTIAYIL